ncbi:unnamed protein product [Meloidogyne enterolobii]|uniref:Uncharacterized protein n=1 Tax=Meloidogyne enterolobii TaxID=390850 RepID=A0ACB0ZG07_MELEN
MPKITSLIKHMAEIASKTCPFSNILLQLGQVINCVSEFLYSDFPKMQREYSQFGHNIEDSICSDSSRQREHSQVKYHVSVFFCVFLVFLVYFLLFFVFLCFFCISCICCIFCVFCFCIFLYISVFSCIFFVFFVYTFK